MILKSMSSQLVKAAPYLLLIFLCSCQNEDIEINYGEADLSRYISVGNSLTAGYSDGGLYKELQVNSYPNILANQFKTSFSQPLMPAGNGSGYIYLISYSNGIPSVNILSEDPAAFDKVKGPFNNLGVPGIRVKDLNMKDYGLKENNPYFYRMIPSGSESNTSYLDLVEDADPTFFTCWLGNNDILGYATSGGADGIEGSGEYQLGGITDISVFVTNYQQLIDELTKNGAKGVVITIPDVSLIPFFNLVSNDDFPTLDENWLDQLNDNYQEFNDSIEAYNQEIEADINLSEAEKEKLKRDQIHFNLSGDNAFIIEDSDLPDVDKTDNDGKPIPKIRQLKEGEKITLTGVLEITNPGKLSGINSPLADEYVLTTTELDIIEEYRNSFNQVIEQVAQDAGLIVVNADEILLPFVSGKMIDGVSVSTKFVEGGLFSLDGVHLTARGYAIVANEIIDVINHTYSAEIPEVNISQYTGVNIP